MTRYLFNILKTRNKNIFLFLLLIIVLSSCGAYSFTGASIPPNIKTIRISSFPNQSTGGPGNLSQVFSEQFRNKIIRETNLSLVNQNADIEFNGAITNYSVQGLSPTAGQTTALNRLSVSVRVEYVDFQNEKNSWNQNFTRYADFDSSQSLSDVEENLVSEINQQLVDDIFNRAFANW